LTVYAGTIQLGSNGVHIGANTLFENSKGTFYFNKQLGLCPATVDGDQFSITPPDVKLENGKTFQFTALKLDGTINHDSGKANLLNKSYRSDASVDGKAVAPDSTYAVMVHANKISTVSTLYKDTRLPQPDQSYKVEPGAFANSYYLAQSEASNPKNNLLVRGAYLALQTAVLPIALAEQAATYTFNMPYFASQGGQYAARASLQKSWGDKAIDGLQAVAAFSNAFVAAEPYGAAAVNLSMKIGSVIAHGLESGLAMRLNPMNYTVEAYGLGSNLGNAKIKYSPNRIPANSIETGPQQLEFGFSRKLQNPQFVIYKWEDLKSNPSKLGNNEFKLFLPDLGNSAANWAQNEQRLMSAINIGKPIHDLSPEFTNGYLQREREMLKSHNWTYDPDTSYWNPPKR
jgi:hypothetical protein